MPRRQSVGDERAANRNAARVKLPLPGRPGKPIDVEPPPPEKLPKPPLPVVPNLRPLLVVALVVALMTTARRRRR